MNIKELSKILEENNVSKECYNLDGIGIEDQRLCLVKNEKMWQVFYSERGQKFDYAEFNTEQEACLELLKRLI